MSEPDRFEAQARGMLDTLSRGQWSEKDLIDAVADRLRAAESSALERAAQGFEANVASRFSGKDVASFLRFLIPPAAAPAAETVCGKCGTVRPARGVCMVCDPPAAETGKAQGAEPWDVNWPSIAFALMNRLYAAVPGTAIVDEVREIMRRERASPASAQREEAPDLRRVVERAQVELNQRDRRIAKLETAPVKIRDGCGYGLGRDIPWVRDVAKSALAARAAPPDGEGT